MQTPSVADGAERPIRGTVFYDTPWCSPGLLHLRTVLAVADGTESFRHSQYRLTANLRAMATWAMRGSPRGSTACVCAAPPRLAQSTATNSSLLSPSAPDDAEATTVAARPGSPDRAPTVEASDFPRAASASVAHPDDRSSVSVPAGPGSWPDRRSIARFPTPPASVRTSACVRWLRSLPALAGLSVAARGKTSRLLRRCASVAARRILSSRYRPTQFAACSGDNHIL
jgi:hypothetical protein